VNVLVTLVLLAALALWAVAVLRRLSRMRDEVKAAWKRLEADQSNQAVKTVYNNHVARYNDSLEVFPANLIGPLAGFKHAKPF
jgi:hypothetical protein